MHYAHAHTQTQVLMYSGDYKLTEMIFLSLNVIGHNVYVVEHLYCKNVLKMLDVRPL